MGLDWQRWLRRLTGLVVTTTSEGAAPDIADYLLRDGTAPMTGALNMDSHKVVNVTNPTSAQDAATKNYADVADAAEALARANEDLTFIKKDGSRDFTGNQSHGGFGITNIRDAAFVDTDDFSIDHASGEWDITSDVKLRLDASYVVTESDIIAHGNDGYSTDGHLARFCAVDGEQDAGQAGMLLEYGYGLRLSVFSSTGDGEMGGGTSTGNTVDAIRIREREGAFEGGEVGILTEPVGGQALALGVPQFSAYSNTPMTFYKSADNIWVIDTGTAAMKLIGDDIVFKDTDQAALLTFSNDANTAWVQTTTIWQKFVATAFNFVDSDYDTGDLIFEKTGAGAWKITTSSAGSLTLATTSLTIYDLNPYNPGVLTLSKSDASNWNISTPTTVKLNLVGDDIVFKDTDQAALLTFSNDANTDWVQTSAVGQKFVATGFTFEDSDYTNGDLVFQKTGASAWLIGSDTSVAISIGNSTDKSTFEANGTLVFDGSATVWDDLNFDPTRSGGPVATRPDDVTIGSVFHKEFTSANNQLCGSVEEIPHKAKLSGTLYPHIHVFLKSGEGAGTTGVTFTFYWELRQSTGTTTGSVGLAVTTAQLSANPDIYFKNDASGFTGPTTLGSQLAVTIARTAGDAGDVVLTTYGVHYEIDTVGSRAIDTK